MVAPLPENKSLGYERIMVKLTGPVIAAERDNNIVDARWRVLSPARSPGLELRLYDCHFVDMPADNSL